MEKHIKNKLENFEVPFEEKHWEDFQTKLKKEFVPQKPSTLKFKYITAATTIIGFGLSVILLLNNDNNNNEEISQTNTVQEQSFESTNTPDENNNNIKVATNQNTKQLEVNNSNTDIKTNSYNQEGTISINSENQTLEKETKNNTTNKNTEDNNQHPEEVVINHENIDNVHLDFILGKNELCVGEPLNYQVNTNAKNIIIDFGDGESSKDLKGNKIYTKEGKYYITATAGKQKFEKTIYVFPKPKAEINVVYLDKNNGNNKLKFPYTEFHATYNESYIYHWDFNNNETCNKSSCRTIFKQKGNYNVTLTLTNEFGCQTSIDKNVTIENNFELLAENSFTPNGDGYNDVFLPSSLKTFDVAFEMIIKDPSGKIVFKTNDYNNPWNGSYMNNGNTLPGGVYFWEISTKDIYGIEHLHVGKINLLKQ